MTCYIFVGEGGDVSATDIVDVITDLAKERPFTLRDILEADVKNEPYLKGAENQYRALVVLD